MMPKGIRGVLRLCLNLNCRTGAPLVRHNRRAMQFGGNGRLAHGLALGTPRKRA